MRMDEYFDSAADYWDVDYLEDMQARKTTALISNVGNGECVLDIACGAGALFVELLEAGAAEVTGVDVSARMIDCARAKFWMDPRVTLFCCDIADFDETGYDAATLFNSYIFFRDRPALIKKVHGLLRPFGRFTVAHGPGREHANAERLSVPPELTAGLLSAERKSRLWEPYFKVDVVCDTSEVYIISGTARQA